MKFNPDNLSPVDAFGSPLVEGKLYGYHDPRFCITIYGIVAEVLLLEEVERATVTLVPGRRMLFDRLGRLSTVVEGPFNNVLDVPPTSLFPVPSNEPEVLAVCTAYAAAIDTQRALEASNRS